MLEALARRVRGASLRPARSTPRSTRALEAICLKAMARRQTIAIRDGAIAEDLELWMGDEPVSAWPDPVSRRAAMGAAAQDRCRRCRGCGGGGHRGASGCGGRAG